MSNSLDPDQARHFVGPDLGPNCLQKLSAESRAKIWPVKYIHQLLSILNLLVWFDFLHPIQQFFSHIGTVFLALTGTTEDKVSCSRTQPSATGKARALNPSILSQALYH